jgi:hypothetical protein
MCLINVIGLCATSFAFGIILGSLIEKYIDSVESKQ